jgi:CheY-like chemotaxis protein
VIGVIRQRADLQHLKIVIVTAWPEERAREMGRAYGCDGVITKPIDTRQFIEQVGVVMPPGERLH